MSESVGPENRRPLTLIEKIIANHAIGLDDLNQVKPGNVVVLGVSWTLSSEASWVGIDKTFTQLGRPSLFRKDRVWLAQDHTVDPRIYSRPDVKKTIDLVDAAAKELGIEDYYGPNYTIMHTEFCRERALPGQVIVGSDSHTCSAGRSVFLPLPSPPLPLLLMCYNSPLKGGRY